MTDVLLRKGLVFGIILLFMGLSILLSTSGVVGETYNSPGTVYVDDDYNKTTPGWGYDRFDKIQNAVENASEGIIIFVYEGIYYEKIELNKPVRLIGQNRKSTFINGGGNEDYIIKMSAEGAEISGFFIKGKGYSTEKGIVLTASHCIVSSNEVTDCRCGIYSSREGVVAIRNNVISYNNIGNCEHSGIFLGDYTNDNSVVCNNITETQCVSGGAGIYMDNSWCNHVIDNYIEGCERGIIIEGPKSMMNIVGCNKIESSRYCIWLYYAGIGNMILSNDLLKTAIDTKCGFHTDTKGTIWLQNYYSNRVLGMIKIVWGERIIIGAIPILWPNVDLSPSQSENYPC